MPGNQSPHLSDRDQRDAAKILYSHSIVGITISIIACLILAFAFQSPESIAFKRLWVIVMTSLLFARLADSIYWQLFLKNNVYNAKQAIKRFSIGCLLTAALWSVYVVVMFRHMEIIELAAVVMLFGCMAGGSAAILSASKITSLLYTVILILPLAICGLLDEDYYQQLLGSIGILFMTVMILTGIKTANFTQRSIHIKNENINLLKQMERERKAVTEANDSLEEKVKQRTAKIYELSNIDPLTGLFNRTAFYTRLRQLAAQHHDEHKSLALFFIDLDGFKAINDSHGHKIGDQLLAHISHRLIVHSRKHQNICRWGGDEFLMVIPSTTKDQALEQARRLIRELSEPIISDNEQLTVGATIGIAMYPEHTNDEEELIKLADTAMYQQKSQGKSEAVIFTQKMMDLLLREQYLREGLSLAIEKEQFHLVYQPILNAQTGEVRAFESLLRWEFEGEDISPDEFITIAEQHGLIKDIGRWVIHKACEDAKTWSMATNSSMSVNVSVIQLLDMHFEQTVEHALMKSGLTPEQLHIEVTESVFAKDHDRMRQHIEAAQKHGIQVMIDDFGTGYSSLSQLQTLKVNTIKIDRSFVDTIHSGGETIIQATVQIAKSLGYKVVAEGVESIEQANTLRDIGVDYLQGFYFAKPMSMAALSIWLAKHNMNNLRTYY